MALPERVCLFEDHGISSGPNGWYRKERMGPRRRVDRRHNICVSYVFAYYQFKKDLDSDKPLLISTEEQRIAIRKGLNMSKIDNRDLYYGDLKAHGDAIGFGHGSPSGLGLKTGTGNFKGCLSLNREYLLRCVSNLLESYSTGTPRLFYSRLCGLLLLMFSDYDEIVEAVGKRLMEISAINRLVDTAIRNAQRAQPVGV